MEPIAASNTTHGERASHLWALGNLARTSHHGLGELRLSLACKLGEIAKPASTQQRSVHEKHGQLETHDSEWHVKTRLLGTNHPCQVQRWDRLGRSDSSDTPPTIHAAYDIAARTQLLATCASAWRVCIVAAMVL
ncbi:hypothetical protein PMIN01_09387 [Paraphaeosphaeria minitans]|uniref:Uncharacterized protein n=1 Tax=Paraphaeosphaeria minitans TaxID=565426 RepID=A0A9P6GE45_9PLEO|nr:hypothetical protein PMIN01_09387 [Paraphaeosphaeria minitans]